MVAVSSISEFLTFDYSSLHPGSTAVSLFFNKFSHPVIPFASVALYLLLSKPLFRSVRDTFGIKPKGAGLQVVTIVHSAALAVYSVWTFVNSMRIVVPHLQQHGFYNSLCDASGDLWVDAGLGFWITHFYISKYYEFIDTWIVILKGRDPMFLQTYHHAGVVILMWGFIVTKNTACGMVLICLNSFIHSLMYSYYVLSAFGYNSPLKHYLTQAQIVQFIVGIVIMTPAYYCANSAQAVTMIGIQAYAIGLIVLFSQFYVQSYSKKSEKNK